LHEILQILLKRELFLVFKLHRTGFSAPGIGTPIRGSLSEASFRDFFLMLGNQPQ